MKLFLSSRSQTTRGYVLLMVTILLAISIIMVTGLVNYSSGNAKQNARNNDYYTALGAAEAATEKALSQVTSDFHDYGVGYVQLRLGTYRGMIPTASEASIWTNFDFMDLSGQLDHTEIDYNASTGSFVPLGSQYGPLHAFKDTVRILSNARARNSPNPVAASVYQDIELSRIPIFQYAVFYNVVLEIDPGPDMTITGPVHCNTNIYLNPGGVLTFNNDLTASGTIYESKNPLSPHAQASGTIVYKAAHDSGTSTLSLPIGTNNTPAAVHQVIELPPILENPQSSLGQQRYYNKADLIVMVSNSAVVVKSGLWNNFATSLSSNEVATFVSTNTSFLNKRENKTIQVIQIDVARLIQWNATNASIRPYLPLTDVRTIYVNDQRTLLATSESGVRLVNGTNLPPQGLTVATPSPLYIQGDYNCPLAARGTTNTTGTLPASVACDAVNILSGAWRDANAGALLSSGSRTATDTTVNAAFLTGLVATTAVSDSGGVENFPRFLEDWTSRTFTYNGSMVCMFYSQIATALWVGTGTPPDIYNPPVRKWSLDQNYQFGDKLPPSTPSLMVLVRANWRTPAAYSTNIMAGF